MPARIENRRAEVVEEAERLEIERNRLIEEQASTVRTRSTLDSDPADSTSVDQVLDTPEDFVDESFGAADEEPGDRVVPERSEQSRYERHSANLPRIGDDAANVVRSLESFRKTLRGS